MRPLALKPIGIGVALTLGVFALVAVLAGVGPPSEDQHRNVSAIISPIRFRNVAQEAGIDFVLENNPTAEKQLIETMPGGVAVFDYDGDGLMDIFFTNGAAIPSLEKNQPKFSNAYTEILAECALKMSPKRRACPEQATLWEPRRQTSIMMGTLICW